ncbi:hypothetical protein D9Q98_005226 [Chlorella vulgaris]|uniref:N-acetyltransferase domain-containing protein n=1 Tax=Chlorella vulgaris TaxID=3077 RepID=A0A9D4YX23_CHLVU|nr:hypothetical protein D9Q98_005226 [Chlorella vulgaris]
MAIVRVLEGSGSALAFAQGGADHGSAMQLLSVIAQALSQEGVGMYLTRRNCEAASRLWLEMLRLTLAGSASPSHPQIYFLSDQSVAAVMQRYPEDAHWHRNTALLRLAKLVPWGKWRALREALMARDKQMAAFADSHGPFLHLVALGCAPAFRGCGLGSMLLDRLCRIADQQQREIYTECSSDAARKWLKKSGFFELLCHSVRPHAPVIYVLVRRPAPLEQHGNGGGGVGGSSGSATEQAKVQRPSASVRTR